MENSKFITNSKTIFAGIGRFLGLIVNFVMIIASFIVATPLFLFIWIRNWVISGFALLVFYYFVVGVALMYFGLVSGPAEHMNPTALTVIAVISGLVSLTSTFAMMKS